MGPEGQGSPQNADPPPAQPLLVKDDEQVVAESILDHQDEGPGRCRNRSFLVLWKGYARADATCEPESNLNNCPASLQDD